MGIEFARQQAIRISGFATLCAMAVALSTSACEVANPAYDPSVAGGLEPDAGAATTTDGPAVLFPDGATFVSSDGSSDGPTVPVADATPIATADVGAPVDVAAAVPPGLRQGLVAYFPLDEKTGAVATDRVSGNLGKVEDPNPSAIWRPGLIGGAAHFDAAATWAIEVPASTSLNGLVGGFTVAAWTWREMAAATFVSVVSRQYLNGTAEQYDLAFESDVPTLYVFDRSNGRIAMARAARTTPLGRWVHVAGTYDGTTARLYVDGGEVASLAVNARLQSDTKPIFIGSNINMGTYGRRETMQGLLDEVVFYDRALSNTEVTALHDLRTSLVP